MALTSLAHRLSPIAIVPVIKKGSSLRIASLHVHSIYVFYTFSVVGKAHRQMPLFTMMHAVLIFLYQQARFILQMLAMVHAISFSFRIVGSVTTLLNGREQTSGDIL